MQCLDVIQHLASSASARPDCSSPTSYRRWQQAAGNAAEFYCRQEGTERIVNAGLDIIAQMYTKIADSRNSPLSLHKLRYKLFKDAVHRKKGAV